MPFRIRKVFGIENGPMRSRHPDLRKSPHGHSRKVEFVNEAGALDRTGTICDFRMQLVAGIVLRIPPLKPANDHLPQ